MPETNHSILSETIPPGVLAAGFCNGVALSGAECGAGSSILDPTVQAASFDGVNPNSFYTAVTQPYVQNYEPHPVWLRDYTRAWLDLGPDGERVAR